MKLSVICPVFNTEVALLESAVHSVLQQDHGQDLELVLVDDGSTSPATLASLARLASGEPRITVLRIDRNTGPAGARNRGIQRAQGDWIGFIDADDLWPRGRLARALDVLQCHPDATWIGGAEAMLGIDGQIQTRHPMSCLTDAASSGISKLQAPLLTKGFILEGMHLGASLVRKSLATTAGCFDPRVLYGEDWIFLCKLSLHAAMYYDREPCYILRRQRMSMMWSAGRLSARYASGQISASRDPDLNGFRREIRWALYRTYKDLAMNNRLNGRLGHAVWFACRAWLLDPRECRDMLVFLRSLTIRQRSDLMRVLRKYSNAEMVVLDPLRLKPVDGT